MIFNPRVASALTARADYKMPLTRSRDINCDLSEVSAENLFSGARSPEAAKAGLLLYTGCWAGAHKISQDLRSAEGHFWHAIVHRQEPDSWNSQYWFNRVGKHPVFGSIQADSMEILERHEAAALSLPAAWDPIAFIDLCDTAREAPGSEMELAAIELQHAEWRRLFEWCAASK